MDLTNGLQASFLTCMFSFPLSLFVLKMNTEKIELVSSAITFQPHVKLICKPIGRVAAERQRSKPCVFLITRCFYTIPLRSSFRRTASVFMVHITNANPRHARPKKNM